MLTCGRCVLTIVTCRVQARCACPGDRSPCVFPVPVLCVIDHQTRHNLSDANQRIEQLIEENRYALTQLSDSMNEAHKQEMDKLVAEHIRQTEAYVSSHSIGAVVAHCFMPAPPCRAVLQTAT